jgi:voltage-gated potassium channel
MTNIHQVHIFGYGRHGKLIAKGLQDSGYMLHILESEDTKIENARKDGYVNVDIIDMENDEQLGGLDIESEDLIVCVMDDEHFNVFLTLSLRQVHPNIKIFAISDSIHTAEKLMMAGATQVIDLYQVSAMRIHNYLNKPVITHLFAGFLGDGYDISFREFVIPEGSFLHGRKSDEIDFNIFNILLIGIIDKEMGDNILFVSDGVRRRLDSEDVLLCMGKDIDLDRFADTIKKRTI